MSSFEIIINGNRVSAQPGMSVLEAAMRAGITIPHLCDGMGSHRASCLLCIVRDNATGTILPACEHPAAPGMQIDTDSDEIARLREESLALLLAEHSGDCIAPCALACPAQLRTDLMVQLVEEGRQGDAAALLYASIPLPRVTNILCKAPCEKLCRRRGEADGNPVSVRAVKESLAKHILPRTRRVPAGPGKILVLGGGAAALAALWHGASAGYAVTLASANGWAGDLVNHAAALPDGLLEREIDRLVGAAAAELVERDIAPEDPLCEQYDGIIDTTRIKGSSAIAREFFHGREAAEEVIAKIEGRQPGGRTKSSPSRITECTALELEIFEDNRKILVNGAREVTAAGGKFCLRCGCEGESSCELKKIAESIKGAGRGGLLRRGSYLRIERHGGLIYTPAKCVRCGLCIAAARTMVPRFPLDFSGRGIGTRLIFDPQNVPSGDAARHLAGACPTGALSALPADEPLP